MTRKRLGLTLLELLISLFLLAMISTAIASVTGYAVHLFDRSQDIQHQSEQMHHRALLRDWIVRADPSAAPKFVGTANDVAFQARSDTALAWSTGRLSVRLRTVQGQTELHLLDDKETIRQTLPLSKTELRLSYYGQQAGKAGWHESWTGQDILPTLVRISGPNAQLWPDFIAMPRLSVE